MKISINETKTKEIEYPCLMVGEDSGSIVFFLGDTKGVFLLSKSPGFKDGSYHDDFNVGYFKPFTGTITLSND